MTSIDLSKYSELKKLPLTAEKSSGTKSISDILNAEISFFEKKFGAKEKEAFYSELGLLLSTGVDIKKAFEIIEEDVQDKKHKRLLEQIKNEIINGKSIYEAVGEHTRIFSKYEVQSIKIGEESGKLPEVLIELGLFYKGSIQLKRQIVGVLTYPVVVMCLAVLIVYFMLAYVVPIFSDVFTQTGGELPAITQFLIRLSNKSDVML
jgi:type IV pilus assembly protein PilC